MTNTTTAALELDRLEALARAATRGPWTRAERLNGPFWHISSEHTIGGEPCKSGRQAIASVHGASKRGAPTYAAMFEANANFIAAANPATILALIEIARRSTIASSGAAGAVSEQVLPPWPEPINAAACDRRFAVINAGGLAAAVRKLEARGFFAASKCADAETNAEMAAVRGLLADRAPATSAGGQDERALFESDARDLFDGAADFRRHKGGEYIDTQVLDMWMGWSARAAIANHRTAAVGAGGASAGADAQTQAARDVLAERRRQVGAEGWTPEHDDGYRDGELARAAAAYTLNTVTEDGPHYWPWPRAWWKPVDARRDLVKAGALVLAEIERIDRAAAQGGAK